MDAIAEAAKIGVGADRTQNYSADSVGIASVYTSISAVSTAFRTGSPMRAGSQIRVNPLDPLPKVPLRRLGKAAKRFRRSVKSILLEMLMEENDKEETR